MHINSIKLEDFRQFKGVQKVDFATDRQKNVTLILGNNLAGKTTFAQAFIWCLYSKTSFADPVLLNSLSLREMSVGETKKVRVTIELTHRSIPHVISREIGYVKQPNGKANSTGQKVRVQFTKDGQQEYLEPLESEKRIKEILPEELSTYFFFDGERIEKIGHRIVTGERSTEFAEAVRSLLGLKSLSNAIKHISGQGPANVVSAYQKAYNHDSDGIVLQLTSKIESIQDKISIIDENIPDYKFHIEKNKSREEVLVKEINRFAEGQKLQAERQTARQRISIEDSKKKIKIQTLLRSFQPDKQTYFQRDMVNKAITYLENEEVFDNVIPELGANAIQFILNQKRCICGAPVDQHSIAHKNLTELLAYIPPKSIGTLVKEFIDKAKGDQYTNDVYIDTLTLYKEIREITQAIAKLTSRISEIDELLQNSPDVLKYQEELKLVRDRVEIYSNQIQQKSVDKIVLERDLTSCEENLHSHNLLNARNHQLDFYITCAKEIHQELKTEYEKEEEKIREELENAINNIFNQIFPGDYKLKIKPNYSVEVEYRDTEGHLHLLDLSTAESISVTFAFISGVIIMMRNRQIIGEEDLMISSEPYPLVMDAPLSAFDKTRIKTVSEILPSVSEQVIFFIKDTDGLLAQEHMTDVIGKKMVFKMHSSIHTEIVEG